MSTLDADSGSGSRPLDPVPSSPPGAAPSGVGDTADGEPTAYERTQATPEFQELRRALRRFAFPATAAFLAWYLLYVLMSGYARGVMDTKVLGNINIAYVFGLLQFVSTFALAYVYARYAERALDPTADALRARLEAGEP